MTITGSPFIVPTVLKRHAKEACYLWSVRDQQAHALQSRRDHIMQVDEQLAAHIEGLILANEVGWQYVLSALDDVADNSSLFVAMVLASRSRKKSHYLLKVVASTHLYRGGLSALAWISHRADLTQVPLLNVFLRSSIPELRTLGLGACGLSGLDPGALLEEALQDGHMGLRSRALRVVGELGLCVYRQQLSAHLDHEARACRFWAAWSLVLLGDREEAVDYLACVMLTPGHPLQIKAMLVVLNVLPLADSVACLNEMRQDNESMGIAILGYGLLGDPKQIPVLLRAMSDPSLAQLAGYALGVITGVAIDEAKLEGKALVRTDAGLEGEPKNKRVEIPGSDELLWPDREKVDQWWQENRSFYTEERYVLGRPVSSKQLMYAVETGNNFLRHSVAIELMLSGQHKTLRNTRDRF